MLKIIDQIGQNLSIVENPKRIISLVPSITELLIDLGLEEFLIGRTKFCIHPKDVCDRIPRLGGTKNPHIEKILALQADIVFANKEENNREHIEAISTASPCYVSDIKNIEDALVLINDIGVLFKIEDKTNLLIANIIEARNQMKSKQTKEKVLYLIWQDPYMSIGSDTYIHAFLHEIGFESVVPKDMLRYPSLSKEQIIALAPEKILLSDEPYPFNVNHIAAFEKLFPACKIEIIDGSLCSWYGSRILKGLQFFATQVA